jgi:hypothetical protein
VIVYRHQGKEEYLDLIQIAFASAKSHGMRTSLVTDYPDCDADHVIPFTSGIALMEWVLAAQLEYIRSDLFAGNAVLFSPDAVFMKPVEEVFDGFDVAVTTRISGGMPINNGVIFLNPERKGDLIRLWEMFLFSLRQMPQTLRNWYGDQVSMQHVLFEHNDAPLGLRVKRLPCRIYNATPQWFHEEDALDDAYIVHFKGARKAAMKAFCNNNGDSLDPTPFQGQAA